MAVARAFEDSSLMGIVYLRVASSDPHIETFDDGDLTGLTQEVLPVIERARAKWEEEPRHPAHERPAPPARRRPQRAQGSAQAGADEGGADDQQQPETLRLF